MNAVNASELVSDEILDYLAETEHLHEESREELSHPNVRFITVRENGELKLAVSWMVVPRGKHVDIEVGAVNGGRAKEVTWIPIIDETLMRIMDAAGASRIMVPVTRPAIVRIGETLRYHQKTIKVLTKVAGGLIGRKKAA